MPELQAATEQVETIKQRRFNVKLTFRFEPDSLAYTVADGHSKREFSVPYQVININMPYKQTVYHNPYLRHVLIFLIFGSTSAFLIWHDEPTYVLLIVFACLIAFYFASRSKALAATAYTMFELSPSPPGAGSQPLRVIDDRHRQRILDKLHARWRTRMRKLYLAPAQNTSPEVKKLEWMLEIGIIDQTEYEMAVEALGPVDAPEGQRRLN